MGLFDDVRVIELATGIAAPYATMFLADHGADVVKVEPATGDPYRSDPGFQTINRNKRSVVVNDEQLAQLLDSADVIVTDRAGEGARLKERYPATIVVAMPPWGERGPYVHDPATPGLVAAATGIAWNQYSYAEVPVKLVVPIVGYGTGGLGALAIAAALFARERDGSAPLYEVSWVAGAAGLQLADTRLGDAVEERPGNAPMGAKGRVPVYRLFEASDGKWFFLACGTVRFYERMLQLIGREDLINHPLLPAPPWGLMDPNAIAFIVPILEEAFATRTREEWLTALHALDIACQPVQTLQEYLASPLAKANNLAANVEHPELGEVRVMGVPIVTDAAPGTVTRRAPLLGEHTAEVLAAAHTPKRGSGQGRAPLDGIDTLDLASFIAGPVVTRHLAMLGANVIKIEPPAGDPFRAFGPPWASWNHGKRSIALDLAEPAAQELLYRLVARSDVVCENFRRYVATRLGADLASLRRAGPNAVIVSSTGYGADASMGDTPAFDPLLQALGGIMAAQGGDDEPVFLTAPVHDVMTPIISAFGAVAALYHRARTGKPQIVFTSLAQSAAAMQAAEITAYAGSPAPRKGGFDFCGTPDDGALQIDGEWWYAEAGHRVRVARYSLINEEVAVANDLLVTHDHPDWGDTTAYGQLIVGAGPPPGRAPWLDEHRDEILAEYGEVGSSR